MRQVHQRILAGWHAISIPAREHIRASQELNQADKQAAATRLLLVDDEPAVRSALGRMLRLEGFDVVCASNCREALENLYEWPIGLVLLDINVANENGWDLCRRARSQFPELRVVAITAKPDQEAAAAASGAHALMEKPLDLPRLLEVMYGLLAEKPAGQESPVLAAGK
jgi:DNA-binding response OmpR family regulator